MCIAAAIAGAAIIGGVTSTISANKAAGAQRDAANSANAEQAREFDLAYQDQAPYRKVGGEALNQLASLYGMPQVDAQGNPLPGGTGKPDYSGFYSSPDYQFARSEGIRGVSQNAAMAGALNSGNALRGVTDFSSGLATQNFGNYTNRLAALAGIGQNSVNTTGNQGIQTGQNISTNLINAGNARASGIQNAFSGVNNAAQGGLSNYLYYQRMQQQPTGYYGAPPVSYGGGGFGPSSVYGN